MRARAREVAASYTHIHMNHLRALNPRTAGILGSFVLASLLVGAAYVFSGPSFLSSRTAGANTTEEILKEYASKDTDADGLTDWQESLYGTDPKNPYSVKAGVMDGSAVAQGLVEPKFRSEEVPTEVDVETIPGTTPSEGSLTEQFAHSFFEKFMSSWGGEPLEGDAKNALLQDLLTEFTARAKRALDSSYTIKDVRTSPSVTAMSYGAAVEGVFKRYPIPFDDANPITLMDAYIQQGDASAKTKLTKLRDAYRGMAQGLAALEVPPALANQHLALIRSFDMLANANTAALNHEKDPVAVLGAIGIYAPAANAVTLNMVAVADAMTREAGAVPEGTPGYLIIQLASFAKTQGL